MKDLISILIVFFGLAIECSAQVDIREFDWSTIEYDLTLEEKKANVQLIEHWIVKYLEEQPFDFWNDSLVFDHFHFYDFSGDGLQDIIYYGPSGSESFITVFLKYQGGVYQESLTFYGTPLKVYKPTNDYPAIITMYEYGCCEDPVCSIQLFMPEEVENKLEYSLTRKINFKEGTVFPKLETMSKEFTVTNDEYNLRSAPSISCDSIENVVATFSKGAKGIAYAEKTDKTGRKWWYVFLDSNTEFVIETDLHAGINNEEQFKYAGWMSSRYLSD